MAAPVLHRVPLRASEQWRTARPAGASRPGTAATGAARHPGQGGTAEFTPQGQSAQSAIGISQQAAAPPWQQGQPQRPGQQQLWNGQPRRGSSLRRPRSKGSSRHRRSRPGHSSREKGS
jgi:hypothetical protein